MKSRILLLAILSVSVPLSTCTKDVYSPDICFSENVLPIFVSNCSMSGCHSAADKENGYDLSNYDGIMKGIKPRHPLVSEIYGTIKGKNPSMPQSPYPKLKARDVTTIKIWIQMGAPNSSTCSACDTTNYTYSGRVKGIMQTWCVGCHSPSSSGGGVDLSSYTGVSNSIISTRFIGSIKHLAGYSPMPKNTNQLQACDITAIEKWIKAGYPNN